MVPVTPKTVHLQSFRESSHEADESRGKHGLWETQAGQTSPGANQAPIKTPTKNLKAMTVTAIVDRVIIFKTFPDSRPCPL
jgi:hypothetical protein